MNLGNHNIGDVARDDPERLLMGEYGGMTNRERAVRVYGALILAVPFVNLLVTSSPTAKAALVAIASFGLAFLVGWRAGYETLHVGDLDNEADDPPEADELPEVGFEEGSS